MWLTRHLHKELVIAIVLNYDGVLVSFSSPRRQKENKLRKTFPSSYHWGNLKCGHTCTILVLLEMNLHFGQNFNFLLHCSSVMIYVHVHSKYMEYMSCLYYMYMYVFLAEKVVMSQS